MKNDLNKAANNLKTAFMDIQSICAEYHQKQLDAMQQKTERATITYSGTKTIVTTELENLK